MKQAFLKPVPNEEANDYMIINGANNTSGYQRNFGNTSSMSEALKDFVKNFHPQAELLIDIL